MFPSNYKTDGICQNAFYNNIWHSVDSLHSIKLMMKMCPPLVPALLAQPGVDDVLGVPHAGEVGHGVHPVTVRVLRPPHHQHPGAVLCLQIFCFILCWSSGWKYINKVHCWSVLCLHLAWEQTPHSGTAVRFCVLGHRPSISLVAEVPRPASGTVPSLQSL